MPPGAEVPINFACIDYPPADAVADGPLILAVPPPVDNRHMLTSLRVEVGLTVTTRNADPSDYRVVVFCDGQWGDDPWDHLAIESLSRVRVRR